MKQAILVLAAVMASAPALAQEDAIYAPCFQQFPAPEEFADASAYIAAMEGAGWTHRTWDIMRNRAAPALAEIDGMIFLPSRFRNVLDAQAYVDQAWRRFEGSMHLLEIFTQGGMSAFVTAVELDPGVVSVRCTFAGDSVPGVAELTADTTAADAEFAAVFRSFAPDLPEGGVDAGGVVYRFQGDDTVLAPLTAREGLTFSFEYRAPE